MNPILFLIATRTKNPLNVSVPNSKVHAIIIKRRHAEQHRVAAMTTRGAIARAGVHRADLLPCLVTLWRVSTRRLDDDGAIAACKWARDGIAEAIGVDDGSAFISFRYGQYRGKRGQFGIICKIERKPA